MEMLRTVKERSPVTRSFQLKRYALHCWCRKVVHMLINLKTSNFVRDATVKTVRTFNTVVLRSGV